MSWHYEPKKRGRRSTSELMAQENKPTNFVRIYEDEYTTTTWKYDLKKFDKGPIEVDIKYKPGAEKIMKQQIAETKQIKKAARQMKKLEKNSTKSKRKILD